MISVCVTSNKACDNVRQIRLPDAEALRIHKRHHFSNELTVRYWWRPSRMAVFRRLHRSDWRFRHLAHPGSAPRSFPFFAAPFPVRVCFKMSFLDLIRFGCWCADRRRGAARRRKGYHRNTDWSTAHALILKIATSDLFATSLRILTWLEDCCHASHRSYVPETLGRGIFVFRLVGGRTTILPRSCWLFGCLGSGASGGRDPCVACWRSWMRSLVAGCGPCASEIKLMGGYNRSYVSEHETTWCAWTVSRQAKAVWGFKSQPKKLHRFVISKNLCLFTSIESCLLFTFLGLFGSLSSDSGEWPGFFGGVLSSDDRKAPVETAPSSKLTCKVVAAGPGDIRYSSLVCNDVWESGRG